MSKPCGRADESEGFVVSKPCGRADKSEGFVGSKPCGRSDKSDGFVGSKPFGRSDGNECFVRSKPCGRADKSEGFVRSKLCGRADAPSICRCLPPDTRSKARRPIKVGIKGRGGRERAETRTLLVCAAHRLTSCNVSLMRQAVSRTQMWVRARMPVNGLN